MVIGAGLAGLTSALALLRAGWRVRVFEQAPSLGEVGAGITVSSGAGRGLASLGLGAALVGASLPIPDIAFVHYRSAELLAGTLDLGMPPDFGLAKPRHIHRADLHGILLAAVRDLDPGAVATGKQLEVILQSDVGVSARFADGSCFDADLGVGADGARSMVRRQLFDADRPRFSGQVAYRCLVQRASAARYLQRGNAVVFVGASRIFNRYLIRRGELVNVVGIARSERWQEEGWQSRATIDEFLSEFDGFHDDVLGLIREAPADSLIKWGLFVREPITQWSMGRVVLVGDAAHPILPFLGLGAALAIEDGIVLARALTAHTDHERALHGFQRSRAERVTSVNTQSIRQGEIIQATDPDRGELALAPSQNSALFDYDPCTAPVNV